MFGRGFLLGTVLGVPIRIDYSWIIIAFLLTASLSLVFGQEYPYLGQAARISLGLSGSLLLFGSVLAHELSHAVVALKNHVGIRGITLFIFGGAAEMVDEPPTARAELEIAVAGPAMSLALAVLFGGLHYVGLGLLPLPLVDLADRLKWMNLVLVAFNLVPGFPLDGGRVLRAMLWGVWGKLSPATRAAAQVGSLFGALVVALGLISIFWYDNVMGGLWFVLIGLFLRSAAGASYQHLVVRTALEGIRARDLMSRDVAAVPPEMSVSDAVERVILPRGVSELPVVDDGRLVGMLQLASIRARESSSWPHLTARDLMSEDVLADAVSPDDEALKVLALLGSEDRLLPVVADGELLGVVTRRDLLRRLQIRLELRH
ncbi:MAG: CBS domain-containing protein [Vicinamibacteria bacterium]